MKKDLFLTLFIIAVSLLSLYLAFITLESVLHIFGKQSTESLNLPPDLNKKVSIPIIIYHYVEIVADKKDFIRKSLSIAPATFESQIKFLREKEYEPVFVRDIPGILMGTTKTDKKPVVLTFDDGYEDFYSDVFPIIKKENVMVTLYLVPAYIGHQNYMTKGQIQEIILSGLVEIGSHTSHHIDLPSVSLDYAKAEVFDSKSYLENQFHIKVETFCYPYGYYNANVVNLVKQAGYIAAVSEVHETAQSLGNLYYLSRIRVGYFNSTF